MSEVFTCRVYTVQYYDIDINVYNIGTVQSRSVNNEIQASSSIN